MRLVLLALLLASPLCAVTYNVGPGQPLSSIGAVPWASLAAGDIVRIHYRATPYAEKWVICRQGSSGNPITVQGVPDGSGNLPVITGANATTAPGLSYWNDNRGILKIGGASTPPDTMPQYIVVENLEFRSAHPSYTFTDDGGTPGVVYSTNASGIYVEKVKHLTVRNCTFTDCGNGFFVAPGSVGGAGNPNLTENVYVGRCYIHGNGISGSAFEHNSYCECNGIVYEFNRYGPPRTGANGNALKDRSANCVVRYNWIEGGNRQLDLVEADGSGIETLPGYNTTHVYGNVLIEPNGAGNSQIIHYGGDNGTTSTYRKGTLHFYNNTIVSTRTGNTTLMRLSTNSETCDCRNNIIYVTAAGSSLGLLDDTGVINYRNNWFKTGYINSHSGAGAQGTFNNLGGNVTGASPGFLNEGGQDFSLAAGSTCLNAGTTLNAAVLPTHNVTRHYVKHQQDAARPVDATFDIGAFESGTIPTTPPSAATGLSGTATMTLSANLSWSDNSSDEAGFRIERQVGAGAFATLTTVGVNVTSYSDTGLSSGQMYGYRIVAYNAAGDAAPSNTVSITAQGTAPGGGGGPSGGGGGGCGTSETIGALAAISLCLLIVVLRGRYFLGAALPSTGRPCSAHSPMPPR